MHIIYNMHDNMIDGSHTDGPGDEAMAHACAPRAHPTYTLNFSGRGSLQDRVSREESFV